MNTDPSRIHDPVRFHAEQSTWNPATEPDHRSIVFRHQVVRIEREGKSPGRKVGEPKRNARRNTVDYRDPLDGVFKRAEGTLEYKGLCQAFRDPSVVKVEPQFGPFPIIKEDGKQGMTTWDARITYSNGFRLLQAYRPARSVAKYNYAATVEHMFLQMPPEICDGAAVITERDIPAWAAANGRHIHSVLNQGHWTMLHEMSAAARSMPPHSVTIEGFCSPFGGIKQTFRTAVYLIAKGLLWAQPGLITPTTLVTRYPNQDSRNA